jgi:hypothetical protein
MAISKIGSRAIIDGSVLAADFAPGTITGAKLAGSIANDKLANSTITIGGEAISLGATDNSLNLIDWQSKVTSDGSTVTTMVAGRGYFVDNSSAAGIVKLPASATIGQQIAIKDYAGNFGTNSLTIQRNGHNIQGAANNSNISTDRASLILVYVDSTKGWLFTDEHNVADLQTPTYTSATGGTVTTSGNDKIHTFTGDGNFVVGSIGNAAGGGAKVSYMVVAGGGSGAGAGGAGGGGGGFREGIDSPISSYTTSPLKSPAGLTVSATTYPITVGGGGVGGQSHPGTNDEQRGKSGSNSVFSTITSAGGGGGGRQGDSGPNAKVDGIAGGSGGGAGQNSGPPPRGVVGAGNTPPVSPSQGNPGGQGNYAGNTPGSGGGGGAGATGGSAGGSGVAGNGGNGATTHITGSPVAYAGGGGGTACAIHGVSYDQGSGGTGGGGASGPSGNTAGNAGTTNRGGGGGAGSSPGFCGGSSNAGGAGGSGIVVIRYKYQSG